MNAVWSFWSKPYLSVRERIWHSEKQHLLSWILSFEQAHKFYPKSLLFTDDYGAKLLVDGLQLEFDVVDTALNRLDGHDPKWWALGKIYTYRAQNDPFIHIDSDVFLWKALPFSSEYALFAQNPEYFEVGASFYRPEHIEALVENHGGWLPEEWRWFRSSGLRQRAECCGVFGGGNTEFIRYYAEQAIRTIEHSANAGFWTALSEDVERNILMEQYLLSACIEYYNHSNVSMEKPLDIRYVFRSMDDAFDPKQAEDAGYTHLIADSKKSKALASNLEKRVKKG